jgi:Tfp pilus assembly protein PilO
MKPKKSYRHWFVALGLTAATTAYVVLYYLSERREIAELGEQIESMQSYLTTAEATFGRQLEIETRLTEADEFIDPWRATLPTEAETAAMLGELHRSIGRGGAAVTRFEPQSTVAMASMRQIPVSLSAVGSYQQISRALLAVEGLPRTLWMTSVTLRPRRATGGQTAQGKKTGEEVECEATLAIFAENADFSN